MSHTDKCRVVKDYSAGQFSHDYKASIHEGKPTKFRKVPTWEVRFFGRWRAHTSAWTLRNIRRGFKSPEAAREAANRWLDKIERRNDEGECV